MSNLDPVIYDYVNRKHGHWSNSTIHTACAKLHTINSIGFKPDTLYQALERNGYGRYTIQSYFILARGFEEEVKKTSSIRTWMRNNRLRFKNCYKEKTKRITKEEFRALLEGATNNDLYNFLVLLGHFGLRRSEAFSAKWSDFTESGFWVNEGKGDKQRFIPITKSVLKGTKNEGLIVPMNLKFREFIRPFTPHDFRAYAITYWVNEKKLNLKEAAVLAGHVSTSTTDRYVRTDLTEIREKLK